MLTGGEPQATADLGWPPAGSVLEPDPFPAAAELVLAEHVLRAELAAGAGVVALFLDGA